MPCCVFCQPVGSAAGSRLASLDGCARSWTGISIPRPAVPFWLDFASEGWAGIRGARSRRSPTCSASAQFEDEWLRGGPVQRWVPKGLRRQADLRLRDRRHHRHPQEPHRDRRLPHRLRAVQRDAARRVLSQGLQLADARAVGPAPAAAGGRAPGQYPRRHLLLRRSRSALGHQADQEGLDASTCRPTRITSSTRRSRSSRPATTSSACSRRRSCSSRWRCGSRTMGTTHPQDGHHRHLLRRHRVHAAVEPLRPRGAARRRLHDADLRQHADGPGGQRAERPAQRLQDHLLRAAAARGRRGGRLRRPEQGRRLRRRPAA